MRVLAIDTALEACSVGVFDTARAEARVHESLPMQRGHAEALMPLIARVLDRARLDFSALDRIAVTIGPGSFTGLRVGIAAARGIALAAGKPAIGLSTLAAFAAPFIAADDTLPVVVAIDARHDHVYLQVFGPGGRTVVAPRVVPLREALECLDVRRTAHHRHRSQQAGGFMALRRARAERRRAARRAPHRLGGAARRCCDRYQDATKAALSARARCTSARRCSIGPPMIGFISSLFTRGEPAMSEASARDASAIAILHGASFRRGWSEQEVEGLLLDRHVITHRALMGTTLAAFIMSRLVEDEAEILSVAVARRRRGRGLARQLLNLHLRRLAGLGARIVFLEVDEHNDPALRLYRRAGFNEVSRRPNYYPETGGSAASALVLRRDLT